MNPSAQALTDYMRELSEEAYSAAWMTGLEFALWTALTEGPRLYGHLDITADHIAKLRMLSDTCGGGLSLMTRRTRHSSSLKSGGRSTLPDDGGRNRR
jgi:hypothetical protein